MDRVQVHFVLIAKISFRCPTCNHENAYEIIGTKKPSHVACRVCNNVFSVYGEGDSE